MDFRSEYLRRVVIRTAIEAELVRAYELHPTWPVDDAVHCVAIMVEEAGESLRAALNLTYHGGTKEELRKELVQTGAMVLRCLEALRYGD